MAAVICQAIASCFAGKATKPGDFVPYFAESACADDEESIAFETEQVKSFFDTISRRLVDDDAG